MRASPLHDRPRELGVMIDRRVKRSPTRASGNVYRKTDNEEDTYIHGSNPASLTLPRRHADTSSLARRQRGTPKMVDNVFQDTAKGRTT